MSTSKFLARYGAEIILGVLVVLVLIALAFVLKGNADTAELVSENHDAAIATCERGNDSRKATVHNYRKDIATFRSDIGFARAIRQAVAPFAPIAQALDEPSQTFIDKHADAIAGKRHTIRKLVKAQAPVAVKPGSVVADCSKAT